eukprot:scaffold1587_cov69-Amphora_coffeaeformis.AAC.1
MAESFQSPQTTLHWVAQDERNDIRLLGIWADELYGTSFPTIALRIRQELDRGQHRQDPAMTVEPLGSS